VQRSVITSKVVLVTIAFDAERKLARAIESCLNQTFCDFTYVVIDNGSSDKTRAVIQKFAKQDNRIITMFFENNSWFRLFSVLRSLLTSKNEFEYLAILDADDEYTPDFLEEMLAFTAKHNLGVAFCGTDWIDSDSGATIQQRTPPRNMILEGRAFLDRFPDYRPYALRVWGALYSTKVLKNVRISIDDVAVSAGDTLFALKCLWNAGRAGFLAKSLHRYHMRRGGHKWDVYIFERHIVLFEFVKRYMRHFGKLEQSNKNYQHAWLFIQIQYMWTRTVSCNVALSKKLEIIAGIFSNDITIKLLKMDWKAIGIKTDKQAFLNEVRDWLSAQRCPRVSVEVVNNTLKCLGYGDGGHRV